MTWLSFTASYSFLLNVLISHLIDVANIKKLVTSRKDLRVIGGTKGSNVSLRISIRDRFGMLYAGEFKGLPVENITFILFIHNLKKIKI